MSRRSPYFYVAAVLPLLCLGLFDSPDAHAQTRAPTPIVGHYPGGHVGIRGGDTPPEGIGFFNFNRLHFAGNLKDGNGKTITAIDKTFDANITGVAWNTNYKLGDMTWGGILAVPFNDVYNRPSGQNSDSSGYGLGDIVFIPLAFYGKSAHFDYQVGAGVWAPSGTFSPGSPNNHGSGFWEAIYSVGGVYYPDGKRFSWNVSAVARIEQNFTQRHTDIHVGDNATIDWGIGSPMIPLDEKHKHLVQVGVSGFSSLQFTRETGTNAALDTTLYRVFAIGPEMSYFHPDWKMKFLFRPQWEFGARNTSQGSTYWFAVAYSFGHI